MPTVEGYLAATDYAFAGLAKNNVSTGLLYDRAFKNDIWMHFHRLKVRIQVIGCKHIPDYMNRHMTNSTF